jgi:amino acid transporter
MIPYGGRGHTSVTVKRNPDSAHPSASASASQRRLTSGKRMPLHALVGCLFFIVSGGPYGLEDLAKDVGFGPAIGVLLVTPLVWSVPTALMVGELASALPDEGGYYAWVRRALGPFWGYQEAWLSLAASVFDMAIYPTLFVLYAGKLSPALASALAGPGWGPVSAHVAVGALMIAVGAAYNLAGAWAVGEGSAAMTVLLLAPFVVLVATAFLGHPPDASLVGSPLPPAGAAGGAGDPVASVDWAGGMLVAMWNYMGWDNASTMAGEVERPQRNYPLAVFAAVGLVALTYVIPIAAMRAAGVDSSHWETGSWVDAARTFGGATLAAAVVAGGMMSAFGMFNALCLSYSRLPAVLAEDGYLPRVLARRFRRGGAPWVAVLACSTAWTLSLGLSFERLVSLDILVYGTSLVLEFVALVVLRVREPQLPRPFRVPGGTVGAAALGVGPVAMLAFALVKNAGERVGQVNALVFALGVVLAGPIVYVASRRRV